MPKTSLLASLQYSTLAFACVSHMPTNQTGSSLEGWPPTILGPDTPSDPATAAYFLNHLSINVANFTRSLEFYSEIFGLRHIFTVQVSKHVSFNYLGHAQGGRNHRGYQTTQEILREKNNNQGFLEMVHIDVHHNKIISPSEQTTTFGHIGIIVPNTTETQMRVVKFPYAQIVKGVGEPFPSTGPVAINSNANPEVWAQLEVDEQRELIATLTKVNAPLLWVKDPDGNLLEIQPPGV